MQFHRLTDADLGQFAFARPRSISSACSSRGPCAGRITTDLPAGAGRTAGRRRHRDRQSRPAQPHRLGVDLHYSPDLEASIERPFGPNVVLRLSAQNLLNRTKREVRVAF